jgi:succinoglycan biosynthesis transport protein ExoP
MSRFYETLKEASRSRPPDRSDREPAAKIDEHPAAALPVSAVEGLPTPSEETGLPVVGGGTSWMQNVGVNPAGSEVRAFLDRKARLIPHAADSVVVEHYRRLRTKLLQEYDARPFRVLMVSSPNPQEGKTVTALNLALSFAMLPSYKVLVVDGDLRKGSMGKWLALDGQRGLGNLLQGTATLEEVILHSEELPVHFVLRGDSKAPPAELLNSPVLKSSLASISQQYDLVLVDSPPLNVITDAHLIAPCCDGILLVTRAYATTRKSLEKAVQDLQPFRIIGAVLNGGGSVHPYHRYGKYS